MKVSSILVPETTFSLPETASHDETISLMAGGLSRVFGMAASTVIQDLSRREQAGSMLLSTASLSVAMPHAHTSACKQAVLAAGYCRSGIPWPTGQSAPAHLVFLLLVPPHAHGLSLRIMGRLARLCRNARTLSGLVGASSPEDFLSQLSAAETHLGEIESPKGTPSFCILGAGNGGLAMAAHLALSGCKVHLWNRTFERIEPIAERGGIDATGEITGFASISLATCDPAAALAGTDIAMVVVPSTAHRAVAQAIAPHLQEGQIVVLNPGRTGGALEVAHVFRQMKISADVYLAEAQTLLYAARVTNPGQVHVSGIKNSVPLAALPAYQTVDVLPFLRTVLPQFVAADNVLQTSFDNIGAVFHPAITLLNAARIEDTHGDFEYYVEGVTPAVAEVLEAIDRERMAVASALGVRTHSAREWLYLAYDAAGRTLIEAMRANPGYGGIKAPGTVRHRYIWEDVPASLVPIASIGEMLNIPTPTIRATIQLASAMNGTDYWKEGRTVERLGISGMSVKDIRFLVVGAASQAALSETKTGG